MSRKYPRKSFPKEIGNPDYMVYYTVSEVKLGVGQPIVSPIHSVYLLSIPGADPLYVIMVNIIQSN